METREAAPTHFLIKIDSFYKSGIDKYETTEFVAGEYKWRLIMYPNGDNIVGKDSGYVSVYLAMADTSSLHANWEVNVVFSLFIYNQISGNFLSSLGRTRRFLGMKSEWGFSKFISQKVLSDPSNGYLVDDICMFGAEVFVLKRETLTTTGRLCLKNVDIPFKREWKIPNFSKHARIWESEKFTAGGHRWKVQLYPKGTSSNVSIFLWHVGPERVQACYTIWIKNQVNDEQVKRTTTHLFPSSGESWGWPSFIELDYINDPKRGLIVNDCCILAIEISSVQAAVA
ncbi:PREDICTED: ubiquitin carboxyl-terminal hydrolase 12-like [Erythranthe guttata]|uniref:ubiquitin carboxyl-terminal hydrolase 12-like n=1 Tax=Erythranthe guttata TaxID=4155 RepID=UPI00064DFFBA|nr:PREDICTED: ubiquitin carboxyl-terminal hydrolase 12-like [Erythranthe guttata]|eukprot:XP_012833016.1 PREDICTED: ubiquitin carboxyl-terminal hydrolase 12-like [Erythranthe guttata]